MLKYRKTKDLGETGMAKKKKFYAVRAGNNIGIFLSDLVEDGKMQNEIRKDFSTKNIAESLYIMYMGIQCVWLDFPSADIDLIFEKNFEMAWQDIEYQ